MKLADAQTNRARTQLRLCALLALMFFTAWSVFLSHASAQQQRPAPDAKAQAKNGSSKAQPKIESPRARYEINWKLDFDGRTYTGTERVRWTNRGDHASSVLYFHLYANLRAGVTQTVEESRLDVSEVRALPSGAPLGFTLDEQATTMRVNLREAVAAGASTEVEIKFKGSVPEIEAEETSLFAHIVQQVGAALRSAREMRRARDVNFRSRGVMLLGTAYPVLATRDGDDWQRKVEASIGDVIFTEAADYSVSIDAPSSVMLFTSAAQTKETQSAALETVTALREFAGENLRNFAIVAGRNLRSEERSVGDVNVRSIYMAEHENVGRRVLAQAADAVRVYVARFGPLPYKTISVVDVPLVAGLGSAEFAGLGTIASALYVDFDAARIRNLPEIIREQRASIEDSLEWTTAHTVAHQWWGAAVGNDPSRAPVLDEGLANWSALLYFKETHTEERTTIALDDQLRGVYKIYRTFGGEDMAADRVARGYRNSFQYAAIVSSKGALMFAALRQLIGDEKFFVALRSYYNANKFEIAEMDDLRGAFIAEAPLNQRRAVARTFNRWLSGKHGDEDIAPPDPKLAAALGIPPHLHKHNDRNAFARFGKFFWHQMRRVR